MSKSPIDKAPICTAIGQRRLLQFGYHGKLRVVAPYCHGTSTRGKDVLRGIQVRGESSSGPVIGKGIGKLWALADMTGLRVLDETFEPDDPNYNPNDSAMSEIHCRV